MVLHAGEKYESEGVAIGPPNPEAIRRAPKSLDGDDSVEHWLPDALRKTTTYYFAITVEDNLVGQIFLHDIDWDSGEALVGYHLFLTRDRGRGAGTKALRLLQRFVRETTTLRTLIIITSRDNLASQGIAQKCGFAYVGPPREDPDGLVFRWELTRPSLVDSQA